MIVRPKSLHFCPFQPKNPTSEFRKAWSKVSPTLPGELEWKAKNLAERAAYNIARGFIVQSNIS